MACAKSLLGILTCIADHVHHHDPCTQLQLESRYAFRLFLPNAESANRVYYNYLEEKKNIQEWNTREPEVQSMTLRGCMRLDWDPTHRRFERLQPEDRIEIQQRTIKIYGPGVETSLETVQQMLAQEGYVIEKVYRGGPQGEDIRVQLGSKEQHNQILMNSG